MQVKYTSNSSFQPPTSITKQPDQTDIFTRIYLLSIATCEHLTWVLSSLFLILLLSTFPTDWLPWALETGAHVLLLCHFLIHEIFVVLCTKPRLLSLLWQYPKDSKTFNEQCRNTLPRPSRGISAYKRVNSRSRHHPCNTITSIMVGSWWQRLRRTTGYSVCSCPVQRHLVNIGNIQLYIY